MNNLRRFSLMEIYELVITSIPHHVRDFCLVSFYFRKLFCSGIGQVVLNIKMNIFWTLLLSSWNSNNFLIMLAFFFLQAAKYPFICSRFVLLMLNNGLCDASILWLSGGRFSRRDSEVRLKNKPQLVKACIVIGLKLGIYNFMLVAATGMDYIAKLSTYCTVLSTNCIYLRLCCDKTVSSSIYTTYV